MKNHFYFVTRMFSGLFESIQNEKWDPTGIPAMTKLVEKISTGNKLTWIISCKTDKESSIVGYRYKHLKFDNFEIHVIPFDNCFQFTGFKVLNDKLNSLFNDIRTIFYCIRLDRISKGNIFYFDRSNIVPALFAKIILRAFVVIRILGVYPGQKALSVSLKTKLLNPLTYIAYKIRYDLAVCTQDGSGVEYYLDRLLHSETPREILLNGIKRISSNKCAKNSKTVSLLFVGKLIEEKGIIELMEVVSILKRYHSNFRLTVIGKGELEDYIKIFVKRKGISDYIHFVGSVEQRLVQQYYRSTDIYISLNKLGNLSNTVLEAMSAGTCVVLLGKDRETHTDEFTEKFVPDDTVVRIHRNDIIADLTRKLIDLLEHPEKIATYAEKMRVFSLRSLWTWDERLNFEIDQLLSTAEKQKTTN